VTGAYQTTRKGTDDAFVSKFNPAGNKLLYSTYLGGNKVDRGSGIAVDAQGNAYITGRTDSTNFPVTPGTLETIYPGGSQDDYAVKLNPTGSALVYSTALGGTGNDNGLGIAVDAAGNAYIVGGSDSDNIPTTPNAYAYSNLATDAFVQILN